jgi:gluconolactonase
MIHRIFVFILVSSFSLPAADPVPEFHGTIERLHPALDKLIAPDAKIEVLASGFNWSEGPVWRENGIVFSDVPENTVFGWKEGDKAAKVVLRPSGSLSYPAGQGSNGLALDAGNLVLCQHGERRVARLEKDGSFTSLADKYDGKRFNSPNDLVIAKEGTIYFTDPPYGLKKGGAAAELAFHGVYSVTPAGKVSLLISDIAFPNGIALSPDQKTLYIAISDPQHTRVCAYDIQADGSAKNGRVFFDAQKLKSRERKGGCDGMKVDTEGNIWATGPGGVLVISKEGKHLGTILTGQATANCAFGGEDRGTLYITADMFLLRVRTLVKGL